MKIKRDEVENIIESKNKKREKLISEIMRPAVSSEKWLELEGVITKEAFDGLRVVECDDLRVEALSIAVMIRKALEEKEKTIQSIKHFSV